MQTRREALKTAAGLLAFAATPAFSQGDVWPSRMIKVIVPLPPGGVMDAFTRLVFDHLSRRLGQTIVIENKPGANGMIATAAVATSDPDGYTLLSTTSSIVQNVTLNKSPGYKMSDLLAVAPLGGLPIAFIVPKTLEVSTLAEFIDKAKASPQPMTYGTYGVGSSAHVIGEVLMRNKGIKLLQVPFRGEAPALTAIISGQIDCAFVSVGGAMAQAEKTATLAIANPKRMNRYPELPTFDEAGAPIGGLSGFSGVFLPVATPKPIADRFATELRSILALPDVTARMLDFGFEPMDDVTDFPAYVDGEVKRWAAAIREFNISI